MGIFKKINPEIEIVVEPGTRAARYIQDLWLYREVFVFVAIRDTLVRYRQAFFGIAWALARPLLVLLFASQVFRAFHNPQQGVPYYLFVLSAAPIWIFFSGSVQDSVGSLVHNAGMISRIYFPRLLLIFSSIFVNTVDFLIGLGFALICALLGGFLHFSHLWLLPFILITLFTCVLGWSIWVAALNTRYRDLTNIAPFFLQILLIASPVGYGLTNGSHSVNRLLFINPLSGIIEAMRYCFLDYASADVFWGLLLSFAQSLFVLCLGFIYFRKIENTLADVL